MIDRLIDWLDCLDVYLLIDVIDVTRLDSTRQILHLLHYQSLQSIAYSVLTHPSIPVSPFPPFFQGHPASREEPSDFLRSSSPQSPPSRPWGSRKQRRARDWDRDPGAEFPEDIEDYDEEDSLSLPPRVLRERARGTRGYGLAGARPIGGDHSRRKSSARTPDAGQFSEELPSRKNRMRGWPPSGRPRDD